MTAPRSQISNLMKGLATKRGTVGVVTYSGTIGNLGALNNKVSSPKVAYVPSGLGNNGGLNRKPMGTSGAITYGSQSFGSAGGLGAVRGDSGAITHAPDGLKTGALGATNGDSGAIVHGPSGLQTGGLGNRTGNPGAITHGSPGLQISPLGGRTGDSGAITHGPSGLQIGSLGAVSGNPGAITHGPSGLQIGSLGSRTGDSGAITHGASGLQTGNLGDRTGNSGAIHYGAVGLQTGTLNAISGNSGAIHRNNTGFGSPGGLGAIRGDSGAINRGPSNISSGGALGGGSKSSSGGGSKLGSSGGLGASRKVGGVNAGSKVRRIKHRPAVFRNYCCGTSVDGSMIINVIREFDEYGNLKPDKLVQFQFDVDRARWEPDFEFWQDFFPMANKGGPITVETTSTSITETSGDTFGSCCKWGFDKADPYGKYTKSVPSPAAIDSWVEMKPAAGYTITPSRIVLYK